MSSYLASLLLIKVESSELSLGHVIFNFNFCRLD